MLTFKKQRTTLYYQLIAGVFAFILMTSPGRALAQAPGGDPGEPGTPCDVNGGVVGSSTSCPLDNWVWVLAIGGTAAGVLNLRNRQKSNAHA